MSRSVFSCAPKWCSVATIGGLVGMEYYVRDCDLRQRYLTTRYGRNFARAVILERSEESRAQAKGVS